MTTRETRDLPPVLRATHVRRTAADAFALFTDRIDAWWPLVTHSGFGGRSTLGFHDGRLVERALDGTTVVWATVVVWEPPHRLVLSWYPGLPESRASRVEVVFTPDEDGTRVELRHDGWAAFGEQAGTRRRAYDAPDAWGAVLDHYGDLAAREPVGGEDLAALAAAYDDFYAEALAGGFGVPAEGEWTAERVVAHVALGDVALASVARAVVAGAAARLDNEAVNDPAVLDAFVAEHGGDLPRMVAAGRATSATLLALLSRLDEEQLGAPVSSRLQDHGRVVVDADMPVARLLLVVQPRSHLPAHADQLRALRR